MSPATSDRELLGACLASCAGALLFNVMPAFVGTAARSFGLGDAQVGWLASAYLAGFALMAVSVPWWMVRFDAAACARAGFVLSVGSIGSCAVTSGYAMLLAAMLLGGMGGGLLFTLGTFAVSRHAHLERAFGLKLLAEVSAGAALLLVLPGAVYQAWDFAGVALVVAGTIGVSGIVALPRIPHASAARIDRSDGAHASRWPGIDVAGGIALSALLLHVAAMSGIWTFLERVAGDYGVDAGTVSTVLTASMAANIGGALLVVAAGRRFGRAVPLAAGMLAQGLGLTALLWLPTAPGYVVGAMLVNSLWTPILSYQCAIVSDSDRRRRSAALISSAVAVGAAIGPAAAGMVAQSSGFRTVYVGATIATLLSMTLLLGLTRRRPPLARE